MDAITAVLIIDTAMECGRIDPMLNSGDMGAASHHSALETEYRNQRRRLLNRLELNSVLREAEEEDRERRSDDEVDGNGGGSAHQDLRGNGSNGSPSSGITASRRLAWNSSLTLTSCSD